MENLRYFLDHLPWFILLLGVLVFIHELGHFLLAKACRVKVLCFSFGFGPKIIGVRRGETEYRLSALPLGGYVKMLGEAPGVEVDPGEAHRSFAARPAWQRALIVFAGPLFNLALAFVIYSAMAYGVSEVEIPRLGYVIPGEPAWQAGLRPGDTIVSIDGQVVPYFAELREIISERPGQQMRLVIDRRGERKEVSLRPAVVEERDLFGDKLRVGRIGVVVSYLKPVLAVVDPMSPAARGGLKTGDVVTAVSGQSVEAWHGLRAHVRALKPASPLHLTLQRGERTLEVSLWPEPGAEPPELPTDLLSSADPSWGYLGLAVKDTLVASVTANTPAAKSGLKPGDRLIQMEAERPDGQRVVRSIGRWGIDLGAFQGADAASAFTLTFQRGREIMRKEVTLRLNESKDGLDAPRKEYVFGATNDPGDRPVAYTAARPVGPLDAVVSGGRQAIGATVLLGRAIARIFSGRISLDTVGGPIMLFQIAAESASRGLDVFLGILAFISINLALLNLLPVPVLDGGHLVFLAVEAIRRKPPSLRVREVANLIGLALLFLLMVLAFRNDIQRLLSG